MPGREVPSYSYVYLLTPDLTDPGPQFPRLLLQRC